MAKHLLENAAAEKEANDVGFRYMNSSDVLSDMIRDYGGALDGVKVHDDAAADAKVRAVGRDGLASGKDVYMREGSLSSGDPAAKGLLAHELTHVMQQDGGAQESVDYGEAQGGLIDWFKSKFGRKKKEAAADPTPAPTEPTPTRTFTPDQADRARTIMSETAAKRQRIGQNFDSASARYNERHPDGPQLVKDSGFTTRQRFFQRFLQGTDEENDAMVEKIMSQGQGKSGFALEQAQVKAMVPTLAPFLRKIGSQDISQIGDENWLLEHGREIIELSQDTQNLSDMFKDVKGNDAQGKPVNYGAYTSKQDWLDAGVTEEEFDAYMAKRSDFALAAGKTQLRLKSMFTQSQSQSDPWAKMSFEADRPATPAPAQQQAPFVPGQGPLRLGRGLPGAGQRSSFRYRPHIFRSQDDGGHCPQAV